MTDQNQTLKWTIDTIRQDSAIGSWVEERKFDWLGVTSPFITQLLEGKAVLILTDENREWFSKYIISNMNKSTLNRPIFPIFDIQSQYAHLDFLKSDEAMSHLEDMLSFAYPQGYLIWYIGNSTSTRSTFAKRGKNNFLWILDEEYANSFYLNSLDPKFDLHLIELFKLLNKSIDAALFEEVDFNEVAK